MRPLSNLIPVLQALQTFQGHLVQIDTEPPLRFCSWGTLTWNGGVWESGLISKVQPKDEAPWARAGTIELADPDTSTLAALLSQDLVGRRIRIWYTPTPTLASEPVLVLDAFCDGLQTTGSSIRVAITADDGAHLFAPRERVTTADYPWPILPGSTVAIGNGTLTLAGDER